MNGYVFQVWVLRDTVWRDYGDYGLCMGEDFPVDSMTGAKHIGKPKENIFLKTRETLLLKLAEITIQWFYNSIIFYSSYPHKCEYNII